MKKIKNIPGMYENGGQSKMKKPPTFMEAVKIFLNANSWDDYTSKLNKRIAETSNKESITTLPKSIISNVKTGK